MSATMKRKEKMTAALCDFIKSIGEKIELMCLPLTRIFSECEDDILRKSGFLTELTTNGSFQALEVVKDNIVPEALPVLHDYFAQLGSGDRDSEVNLCRASYSRISDILASYRESLPGKLRIYRTLPLMMSLCAVILII